MGILHPEIQTGEVALGLKINNTHLFISRSVSQGLLKPLSICEHWQVKGTVGRVWLWSRLGVDLLKDHTQTGWIFVRTTPQRRWTFSRTTPQRRSQHNLSLGYPHTLGLLRFRLLMPHAPPLPPLPRSSFFCNPMCV